MDTNDTLLFALHSSKVLGEHIAKATGLPLSNHEERDFADGEHKIRSLVGVNNKHVFVISSLFSDERLTVNDKLCRLLFFIGSLKDAGALKVTVIAPYLCYSRKDRKTKDRDPITTKYVASLFKAVGTDTIMTLDVHNIQAFENAFHIPTIHVEAKEYFASHFAPLLKKEEIVVLSPDTGGIKRANALASTLEAKLNKPLPVAVMHKTRSKEKVGGRAMIFGDVQGKTVIIIDDLISSGTTLVRAATACKQAGAKKVFAVASHGVFSTKANEVLKDAALDRIVITNSIPLRALDEHIMEKIQVLDIAPLIGKYLPETKINIISDNS